MVVGEYTGKITDYIVDFCYGCIPEEVVEHSKLVVLDTIGAMLAASNPSYPASTIIRDHVLEQAGREEASVVGRSVKVPATNAALANGTLAYLCDIESYHVKAVLHETAVVLPASLAIAESESADGKDLLTSFVLGLDVETRLSYAISPTGMYARGFHPTVVAGCLGAAASTGKLLSLERRTLANALGLAAVQSSGLLSWESDVTEMSRPFGCGIAAQNGVKAALLARGGFGGPEVLEGKYTVFNAFSGEVHVEELLEGYFALGGQLFSSLPPLGFLCLQDPARQTLHQFGDLLDFRIAESGFLRNGVGNPAELEQAVRAFLEMALLDEFPEKGFYLFRRLELARKQVSQKGQPGCSAVCRSFLLVEKASQTLLGRVDLGHRQLSRFPIESCYSVEESEGCGGPFLDVFGLLPDCFSLLLKGFYIELVSLEVRKVRKCHHHLSQVLEGMGGTHRGPTVLTRFIILLLAHWKPSFLVFRPVANCRELS